MKNEAARGAACYFYYSVNILMVFDEWLSGDYLGDVWWETVSSLFKDKYIYEKIYVSGGVVQNRKAYKG